MTAQERAQELIERANRVEVSYSGLYTAIGVIRSLRTEHSVMLEALERIAKPLPDGYDPYYGNKEAEAIAAEALKGGGR